MFQRSPMTACIVALAVLGGSVLAFGQEAPWRRRRRRGVTINRQASERVNPDDWPREPGSPEEVDPERFARAIRQLCGWMPPSRPQRYAGYVLSAASEFEVDPFLLAGLMHRMGRCNTRTESMGGLGLTAISRAMHAEHLRRGEYRYHTRQDGEWQEHVLDVSRFPFSEHRLRRAEENLYFAAAIMRVFREQHLMLGELHAQPSHRHYISHFVWGDHIRSDRAEDRILTDRRRILQYYGAIEMPEPIQSMGMEWGAPLDGSPRVVSSWIGANRDGGARSHRGIDVESVLGEPVRAVADGRVNFSGVDLPGSRANRNMRRSEIEDVPRQTLGRGGRYVCVLHHPEQAEEQGDAATSEGSEGSATSEESEGLATDRHPWLRSCYMHLEDVEVEWGQEVRRGDLIGTVGRTGMLTSAPHLHLELHSPDGLMDASEVLAGHLIGHPPAD